jgi:hypothetical protein
MAASDFACLMYHDLGTGTVPRRHADAGHLSYVVSGTEFARQMNHLRARGWKGCKVSEALEGRERAVALTFDDGTSSDIELAAPALSYTGFTATFYVVSSWVDTPGYLSRSDLRSLERLGCEIGSHSVTHAYLPRLAADNLRQELSDSKDQLEQWTGAPVLHFSCPFGGYTPALAAAAREIGYSSVATSQVGMNGPGTTILNRVAVRRNTSLSSFGRMCAGKAFLYPRTRQAVLAGVKSAIGFSAYSLLCRLAPHGQAPPPREEPAEAGIPPSGSDR